MTDIVERLRLWDADQWKDTVHKDAVEIYRYLDGMTALATAAATPLRQAKGEKDTAFVKRIVATYMAIAAKSGVHDEL